MVGLQRSTGLLLAVAGWVGLATGALAQNVIIPDGTLGAEPSVVTDFFGTSRITGGAVRGTNLFHSFDTFNVGNGGSAFFVGGADTTNIFSRVTGANPSEIFGTLGTAGTTANLYFINPNGIVFGEEATLQVGGSFTATTASSILFGDVGTYSAVTPAAPDALLTVDPSAYFFGAANPADITTLSTTNALGTTAANLQVPDGATLTLLGGNITLDGADLAANEGRIELGSVGSSGGISLNPDGSLTFPDSVSRADISLFNDADITSIAAAGGTINVNANNLSLAGGSALFIGLDSGSTGTTGDITIQATGNVGLNSQSQIGNQILAGATGATGDIVITAANLGILDNSQISTFIAGSGTAGSINMTISSQTAIDGENSYISSDIAVDAVGNTGDIQLSTTTLALTTGGQIRTSHSGNGNTGAITVTASDTATINGASSGIFNFILNPGVGEVGTIQLNTGNLDVTGGGIASFNGNGGNTGGLSVVVDGTASLDGEDSRIYSNVANGNGSAGAITIEANTFALTNGAQVYSLTSGAGGAEPITLTVATTATLSGTSPTGAASAIFSETGLTGGDGGALQITAGALTVADGARLLTTTGGVGNGGDITIQAGTVEITGDAATNGTTGLFASSLGTGDAGNIVVGATTRVQLSNANIAIQAAQAGGGSITLTAPEILLAGDGDIITTVASGANGGGSIALTADSILVFGDSDIYAFTADDTGGTVAIDTTSFLSNSIAFVTATTDAAALDGNGQVDITASGNVGGTVVAAPDNTLVEEESVDAFTDAILTLDSLLELGTSSCIAQSGNTGRFVITGSGGIPPLPSDIPGAVFATGGIRMVPAQAQAPADSTAEPTGVFRLADGRLVLSQRCEA